MNYEWYDWAVMCFLFIPSVIGVIIGSVLTLLRMQNESSQKLVTRQEPSMSDYRCTQANLLYLRATTPTL